MNYAPVETVRVSELGKRQLTTLKRRTGIRNWNVICRWAVCVSLGEPSRPPIIDKGDWSNVEMNWSTFGGPHADIYSAVFMARCSADGLDTDPDTLAEQFRLHLHRGIGYLAGDPELKTLSGLVQRGC